LLLLLLPFALNDYWKVKKLINIDISLRRIQSNRLRHLIDILCWGWLSTRLQNAKYGV